MDKGHLLSTRDLCGLEFLPNLINSGVCCFKIEGRLKNPEYVATVTRIYRKYIDMVLNNQDYIIDPSDKKIYFKFSIVVNFLQDIYHLTQIKNSI